jgi:hypothetical protein
VCLVKDAAYHVRPFIEHYLRLGVTHLVLLDTGSTDDTVARASAFPAVSVFETDVPFRRNNRQMRRYLVRRFGGRNRWVLVVDVDEFFDYPCSDRVDLASLLRYLTERRFTTLAAYLLDMLPAGPVDAVMRRHRLARPIAGTISRRSGRSATSRRTPTGGDRWVRHNTLANPDIKRYVGGIRGQIFDLNEVYLLKHPLLLRDGRTELVHQHFVDFAVGGGHHRRAVSLQSSCPDFGGRSSRRCARAPTRAIRG